jgi:bifunctional DNA-binding transcriptional regulator/antitoxin component of YhaV-PrlF toxin-antitoxin module
MSELSNSQEVRMGCQGRLVIPASLRRSMKLNEGDRLIARQVEGCLVLEKQETIKKRLKNRFIEAAKKGSLTDELIAERREAAKRGE